MISDSELEQRVEALVTANSGHLTDAVAFRGAQFDAGLAMVHFPEGHGGLGLNRAQQSVVDDALRKHGVEFTDMAINAIGIGMGAPTVLTYGDDELKARHLRRIFTGEDVWCQMFSEPTHGSDVVGIPSMAVRDGDEWVVNGQKVWTSLADRSNFGMLLVRTNPDVPKHKGLSYFVLDMHTPGVEIRPLYQLTGEAEFNEVFLTDVRVPDRNRLGAEGEGWRVAITTLMNERVALGGGGAPRGSGPIAELLDVWRTKRDELDPALRAAYRERVADLWIRAEVVRLTNQRARASATGGSPGPEGSVGKLASAELGKRIHETTMDLLGAEGMLHTAGYPMTRNASGRVTAQSGRFLRSRANTIEGGTSEIMRNILGERMLGLPGDIRVDTDVPWKDIPR